MKNKYKFKKRLEFNKRFKKLSSSAFLKDTKDRIRTRKRTKTDIKF